MKYRILIVVACLVLSAAILLMLPSAHPQLGSTEPTMPPTTTIPAPMTSDPAVQGVVRIYSCNEQWLAVFDTLAAQYSALTGIEVVVLRPQEDGCEASLERLMASEEPPVMLCIHNRQQLEALQDTLFDLHDTALAAELVSSSFGLHIDGDLLGVAVDLDAFGLLVNAELLGTKGAMSRADLTDLSALTTAAQILKSSSVKAFPPFVLDAKDLLHLAATNNAEDLRAFLDLFATYGHSSGDALELFLNGECAFYLGGTWDYDLVSADSARTLQARNLDIVPTFSAGALQYTFSAAWCFNGSVLQEDLDATLQFMAWLVTAGEDGLAPVDSLQMLTPFADATWYDTQLDKKLHTYMRKEPAVVQWTLNTDAHNKLVLALRVYLAERTNAAWSQVINNLPTYED